MRPPLPQEDLDYVLTHTADFWSRFHGSRILITGATGFIGSWLMETILRANEELGVGIKVIALSRFPQKATLLAPHVFCHPDVTLLKADVRSRDISTGPFDVCIHAATDVGDSTMAADYLSVFDVCVQGTRRMLELADSSGAKYFLLTSSGAVYGQQPANISHMDDLSTSGPNQLEISSAYAEGKRAAEWQACAYAKQNKMSVAIARLYAFIGPGLPLSGPFAAGNFIRDAIAGRPIQIQGDGRPLRSYLYMADTCVWLLKILMSGASGRAYNVGSENALSIAELAQHVTSLCGNPLPIEVMTPIDPSKPVPRYVPDTSRARSELDLHEYTPIDQAFLKTIEWCRQAQALPARANE